MQTRQGNPAWAGQKRDGQIDPIRSDDLFFPNWVNLGKVAIPQADEQQRLLANLVTQMSADRVPDAAVLVLPARRAGGRRHDRRRPHERPGREAHFDRFLALSPAGCSVADWDCVRSTSYVYAINDMTADEVAAYQAQGFEIALHLNTGCADFTEASLRETWADQRPEFLARWADVVEAPRTNRTHCIAWSDWASEPKVGREFGIRLDTNYYYWPGSWVQDRPGMFTGSGIPMRFADLDGSLIDVYQATTQITDESEMNIATHIAALLDRALGTQGYYGAFTANMHSDRDLSGANAIVAAAQARGVPVISAEQLLDWVEGRNNTSFAGLSFDGTRLRFSLNPAAGARGLEAMVPAAWAAGRHVGPDAQRRSRRDQLACRQGDRVPGLRRRAGRLRRHVSARERPGSAGRRAAAAVRRAAGPARPTGASASPPRAGVTRRPGQAAGELPAERAPLPCRPPAAPRRHDRGPQEVPRGRRQDPAGLAAPEAGCPAGAARLALDARPGGGSGSRRGREPRHDPHPDPPARPAEEMTLKGLARMHRTTIRMDEEDS